MIITLKCTCDGCSANCNLSHLPTSFCKLELTLIRMNDRSHRVVERLDCRGDYEELAGFLGDVIVWGHRLTPRSREVTPANLSRNESCQNVFCVAPAMLRACRLFVGLLTLGTA